MTRTVSKSKFKPRTLQYLREVEETGEPIIITDRGRPVVRIEPYTFGHDALQVLRGSIVDFEDPTEPVGEADWEAGKPISDHT